MAASARLGGVLKIFSSATSADLGAVREAARDYFNRHDHFKAREQKHRDSVPATLLENDRHQLADCDAVLHIVGECYGAEPPAGAEPSEGGGGAEPGVRRAVVAGAGGSRRSYTQREYDYAIEHGRNAGCRRSRGAKAGSRWCSESASGTTGSRRRRGCAPEGAQAGCFARGVYATSSRAAFGAHARGEVSGGCARYTRSTTGYQLSLLRSAGTRLPEFTGLTAFCGNIVENVFDLRQNYHLHQFPCGLRREIDEDEDEGSRTGRFRRSIPARRSDKLIAQSASKMNLKLRRATEEDFAFARAVHHASYRKWVVDQFGAWDEDLQDRFFRESWDRWPYDIIEMDGQPAGFCAVEYADDATHVREFALHPEFQGRGVGAAWLRSLVQEFHRPEKPVRLRAFKANLEAISFYKHLGFVETGATNLQLLFEWQGEMMKSRTA